MKDTLAKICGLLSSEEAELQCAAARVLGEIGDANAEVLKALHGALRSPNHLVAAYALDSVGRLHSTRSIPHVVPLLNGPQKLSEKATEVLVGFGQAAVPVLLQRLPRAAADERRALMRALALVGGKAATPSLIESVFDENLDVARAATSEIRAAAEKLEPNERAELAQAAVRALSDKRARKSASARASLARILGSVGGPTAERALLSLVSRKEHVETRRAALLSLEQLALQGAGHDAVAKALVPLLRESDWQNVVSHALQALQRLPIPRSFAPKLLALLASPHPPIRRFSVEKLGGIDSAPVAAALVKLLDHEDPQIRDRAAASLVQIRSSTPLLAKTLRKGADADTMWTAARVLKSQGRPLKTPLVRVLSARLADWLGKGDRRAEPLLHLMRHVDPKRLEVDLLSRARRAKSARRFGEAITYLMPLTRIEPPPTEALIELAVARIALSTKDLALDARRRDEGLALLERLVRLEGARLAKRLVKERALAPDGLLYVGFHFAERLLAEREFGAAVLKKVRQRYARTAAGKAARNKLALEAIS